MLTTITAAFLYAVIATADVEIVVGENVRVSAHETPYVEPYLARHPRISGRLVAAATKFTGSKPNAPVVFISNDGGGTWRETPLPIATLEHAVDCWVAFSDSGTAYASFLIIETGAQKTRIAVFRSDDGGGSWVRATTIGAERSFDRPSLIARGREVVIAAESGRSIALLHSDNGARTFGPPRLLRPTSNLDHNAMNPSWRGTSVVLLYVDFGETLGGSRLAVVETPDLGRTWSTPAVVADVPRRFPGNAHFATAGLSSYVAFASGTAAARTVSVARSTAGERWLEPTRVSTAGEQAFRPAIAVSDRGDVGVTWIEAQPGCTRLWFSVSTDDGLTFRKPVPVSEEFSCGDTAANRAAFTRWEHGGDYFGLTADGDSFVAMWPDARGGTFQIYAARIAVTPAP